MQDGIITKPYATISQQPISPNSLNGTMNKSHKIKLYPTKSQEVLLRKSCGVARFSYNWALTTWKEMYEAGGKPSAYTLITLQNRLKRDQMPFFLEVSKTAAQYAIINLETAYKKMWKYKSGYPK